MSMSQGSAPTPTRDPFSVQPTIAMADAPVAMINPTDMDVDPEDSLLIEHEHTAEKTDTDFFNDFADDFDDEDLN